MLDVVTGQISGQLVYRNVSRRTLPRKSVRLTGCWNWLVSVKEVAVSRAVSSVPRIVSELEQANAIRKRIGDARISAGRQRRGEFNGVCTA